MSRINSTDHLFHIGSSHEVNQDWATSGKLTNGVAYSLVSDGCSGSHDICGRLDVGSRLIGIAAENRIQEFYETGGDLLDVSALPKQAMDIIFDAHSFACELSQISSHILYSTLLFAVSNGLNTQINFFGDGWAFWRKRDEKTLYLRNVDYNTNASFYLAYLLEPKDEATYHKYYANGTDFVTISDYEIGNPQEVSEGDKSSVKITTTKIPVAEYVKNRYTQSSIVLADTALEYVGVSSDGASSFQQRREDYPEINAKSDIASVLVHLFNMKNSNGKFLHRRFGMFKSKEMKNYGMSHTDDLSIAGCSFNKE